MKRRKQLSEYLFRLRLGAWCSHVLRLSGGRQDSTFTPWRIVDGMRKMRWCQNCGRTEFV